jgi:hypothetical protein
MHKTFIKTQLLTLCAAYNLKCQKNMKNHDIIQKLKENRATSLDFGILLCIVGGTESVHGFPTDKNDRCVFTRDSRGEVMIFS